MVYAFSKVITKVFDLIVFPFGSNRVAALSVISALTGVALIFVFKAVSDQKRIKETRDKFKARILEMRLYQNDIVLIHKALFGALGTNLAYLRVSLKPILVLLAFVFLIFVQLDERYGRAPMETGDTALLTVTLHDGVDPMETPVDLSLAGGLTLDAPPVRSSLERSVYWRIRAGEPGTHNVKISVGGDVYEFPVRAEISNGTIGHVRTADSIFNPLLFPSLPMFPGDSPFESVEFSYPSARYALFMWDTHWLVVFIVFSFIGALIPKFVFKIEI